MHLTLVENRRKGHGDLRPLSKIAHIGQPANGTLLDLGACRHRDRKRVSLKTGKKLADFGPIDFLQCSCKRNHAVNTGWRRQHTNGTSSPRAWRTDDLTYAKLVANIPGVDRTGPTRRKQSILARHASAFRDGDAGRPRHILVHDVMNA